MIIKGTSCYENAKGGNLVSITGDGGNAWGFFGPAYKALAPKKYIWEYYDQNPDNLSEEELINWYIKEYYDVRLKNQDPYELLDILKMKFGENIILLCHEKPGLILDKEHFCHRHVDSAWIEVTTGIIIPEVLTDEKGAITKVKTYDLKPKIKELIKGVE